MDRSDLVSGLCFKCNKKVLEPSTQSVTPLSRASPRVLQLKLSNNMYDLSLVLSAHLKVFYFQQISQLIFLIYTKYSILKLSFSTQSQKKFELNSTPFHGTADFAVHLPKLRINAQNSVGHRKSWVRTHSSSSTAIALTTLTSKQSANKQTVRITSNHVKY